MNNSQPALKYGLYGAAVVVIGCLAYMNVAWALAIPEGPFRYIMIAFSLTADVGAPMLIATFKSYHQMGKMVNATGAVVLWLVFCGIEIGGATEWLKINTAAIESPADVSERAIQEAQKDLEAERGSLKAIKDRMLSERKESKIAELRIDRDASQKRINELSAKAGAARVAKLQNWFFGKEVYLAVLLSVVGQYLVSLAMGVENPKNQHARTALDPEILEAIEMLRGLSQHPLKVRHMPDAVLLEDKTEHVSLEQDRTRQPTRQGARQQPTKRLGDVSQDSSQTIEKTREDTVSIDGVPQQDGQCLAAPANEMPDTGQSETGVVLLSRFERDRGAPEQDSFDRRVSDLRKAGFSIRQIVTKLGCTKGQVEAASRRLEKNTTKGRP
jgi:hypothetical protein